MNKAFSAALANLLDGESHITVALSGGQDSVVLTHLMKNAATELGFTLSALHIHHGIRAASDEEEQFVRALCKEWDIPLTVRTFHLREEFPGESSLEAIAHHRRYQLFDEFVTEDHLVATAHHLQDNMETFFINLCRGSGCKGLSGIAPKRNGIIRPLLDFSKEEIKQYAQQHGLRWVEDESNTDTYYLRNHIRHNILPALLGRKDVSFAKGFAATVQNLRLEDESLEQGCPEGSAAVLWRNLKKQCPPLSRERFERIYTRLSAGEQDFSEQIAADLFCYAKAGKITFSAPLTQTTIEPTPLAPECTLADGRKICLKEIHSEFTNFDIDCDKINGDPLFRSRRVGDEIALPGRPKKSVKKLFCEHKVERREEKVLISDDTGVVWIEGFGSDRRCTPTKTTKKAWRIEIR